MASRKERSGRLELQSKGKPVELLLRLTTGEQAPKKVDTRT